MSNIGFATISVIPSFKGFSARARAGIAAPLMTESGKAGEASGRRFTSTFAKVVAVGTAAAGAVALGKRLVDAATESQKVGKQTDAVLKSMGDRAGLTSKQVGDLATNLSLASGVDDEAIQSASNVLLTFGNIGEDVFARAQTAALDMSVAMGQDLQGATVQVGKALNDPIKGITALSRVGVQFTDQQKDQIKALVESGDKLGAQKIILKELEHQFKGSAKAQATSSDKLKVAIGNVEETLGGVLLPIVEKVAGWLAKNLPKAIDFLTKHKPVLVALGVAAGVAFTAWAVAAAQAAVATIAATWPVIAIIAALAALVAGIIYAYTHWGWFKTAVDAVAGAVKAVAGFFVNTLIPAIASVVGFIADHWRGILQILTGPIGLAITFIVDHFNGIVDTISTVVSTIAKIGKGMWHWVTDGLSVVVNAALSVLEGLVNGVIMAINAVIRTYNLIPFHKDVDTLGHVSLGKTTKGIGSRGDVEGIHLASGGIVRAVNGGVFANIGEGRFNEAVVPLSPATLQPLATQIAGYMRPLAGGSSSGVAVDLTVGLDPRAMNDTTLVGSFLKALRIRQGARSQIAA